MRGDVQRSGPPQDSDAAQPRRGASACAASSYRRRARLAKPIPSRQKADTKRRGSEPKQRGMWKCLTPNECR